MQKEDELIVDGDLESSAQSSGTKEQEHTKDDDTIKQQSAITEEEAVKVPFSGDKGDLESSAQSSGTKDWEITKDDDIMKQQSAIKEEAVKFPFIGDKEPLSLLAAEYESGSAIMLEKIKVLDEQYVAIRRTRGDGNCFFRGFMFSYLEHILESQDQEEVNRIKAYVEHCRETLKSLNYPEFTFEDFFALFLEQLDCVLQGHEDSISHDELVQRSRDQSVSDYVVMFFRFVTSGEIRKRSAFFEPFISGLTSSSVEKFCKTSVEPMGEESDHVQVSALTDALGVPIRVAYLDRSPVVGGGGGSGVGVNYHDFIPDNAPKAADGTSVKPAVILLYRPGHYDILYPK